MSTKSLYKGSDFHTSFYNDYSKFKHGSKTQARKFGKEVADVCFFNENASLIFYSAPYNNIYTASNAFKDYLMSYLSIQFMDKNIQVKQSKIHREYSYDEDYGLMSKEQRVKAISSDIFKIDKSIIKENDTLVFVDDIKITGSHEQRIKELLKRENINNKVIFIYIAQYTGNDPKIEHRLNHDSVTNLIDINIIIRDEEFIFNTRVVKYILRQNTSDFFTFINYQSQIFKETLLHLSILNDYHKNEKYYENIMALRNFLSTTIG